MIRIFLVLAMLMAFPVHANAPQEIEETRVEIANGRLTIADVKALLAASKKKQVVRVVKTSLWNEFEHPPILVEIARQNDKTVNETILILAEEYKGDWNPYVALLELDDVFNSLPDYISIYQAQQLLQIVTEEINREITRSLGETI